MVRAAGERRLLLFLFAFNFLKCYIVFGLIVCFTKLFVYLIWQKLWVILLENCILLQVSDLKHKHRSEVLNLDLIWWRLIEYQRSHFYLSFCRNLLLIRNIHIWKIMFQCLFTLNPSVSNFANFIWVKTFPLLRVEIEVKLDNKEGMHEIYKGVPDVAFVFEIDW